MPPHDDPLYCDEAGYRLRRDLLRRRFAQSFTPIDYDLTDLKSLPLPENTRKEIGLSGTFAQPPGDVPKRRFRDDG